MKEIKPDQTPIDDVQVPVTLTVYQINYLLAVAARRPLDECLSAFNALKSQADAFVAQMNEPPLAVEPAPTLEPLVLDKEGFLGSGRIIGYAGGAAGVVVDPFAAQRPDIVGSTKGAGPVGKNDALVDYEQAHFTGAAGD